MIEIRGVSKVFQGEKAVDSLSLTVQKGTIYGLLGSNGAGKTTLLKTLAGIYRPDEGTVTVGGEPVFEAPDVKRRIIFMPDSPYFFPQASVRSMAAFTGPSILPGVRSGSGSWVRLLSWTANGSSADSPRGCSGRQRYGLR